MTSQLQSDHTEIERRVNTEGIVFVPDIYSVAEMASINRKLNPVFEQSEQLSRSYVRPDVMFDIGVLYAVLSPRMKEVIFSTMPDPVLYHFHFYEIAAKQAKSHIFSEKLAGWHRDPDSNFRASDPTHVSIFVYFSDVGASDGPFELAPNLGAGDLKSDSPVNSMQGPAGTSFVWHRRFYHRASPNRGERRRRVLKISIQRNEFASSHLKREDFKNLFKAYPRGDRAMDVLLGRYQGEAAPALGQMHDIKWQSVTPSRPIDLPADMLATMATQAKIAATQPVEYD